MKGETRFTPWPWRWWTSNSRLRLSSDATGKDGDVLYAERLRDGADVVTPNPADRPLIAAAPLLHHRLTEARTAIASRPDDALGHDTSRDGGWPFRDELLHRIDEALAAARGENDER